MNNFTIKCYINTLSQIVRKPGKFFSKIPEDLEIKFPFVFLIISCIISSCIVFLTQTQDNSFLKTGIYFINSIGMVFIAAGFSYALMTMFMKKRVTFTRFFSIYAFSTGVTVLVSWISFCIWMIELWKWWLIGTGMIKNFGFKKSHTIILLASSVLISVLFFWSLLLAFDALKKI